jgi:hypothetical protein
MTQATRAARVLVLILAIGTLLPGCGERGGSAAPTPLAPAAEPPQPERSERTPRPSIHELFNAPPKSDYETAVTSAIKVVVYAESLQPFCSRWFPTHGRKGADAYLVWRKKYGAAIDDTKAHALKLWESRAGEHKAVAARVYASLRNDADRLLMREFDAMPVKEFEQICVDLPRSILSPEWNLERKLSRELAQIRANP